MVAQQEIITKKSVTKLGSKFYRDEDIEKVFGPRIPSFEEEEVEDVE